MYIKTIQVKNYRSIDDSGVLTFAPGFNLIVGANNVGKSSMLNCIAARFISDPHKSTATLRHREDPIDPTSKVEMEAVLSKYELARMIGNSGQGDRFFPWPQNLPFTNLHNPQALNNVLEAEWISFSATLYSSGLNHQAWGIENFPATRLYDPMIVNGQYHYLGFNFNPISKEISSTQASAAPRSDLDFGLAVISESSKKIYKFNAERLNLHTTNHGSNSILNSDASNLAEVLTVMQGNPERFRSFCDLIREVFPSITKISVRPSVSNSNMVEIMVWQIDPTSEREDLAISLDKCGTGVGQVLAMLYVAKTSPDPRTIIIDEPGSFLNPGASRALIQIFKRFSLHQYIIATHSPEIISDLSSSPLTVVRWKNSKSVFEQYPHANKGVSEQVLNEIGARLSDVFGFDSVLWVEGQSDALSLKALLTKIGKPLRRTAILPVHDTNSFKPREMNEVWKIYKTLSVGDALLPPALLFLFDREGRPEKDIADMVRQSQGQVKFLTRRMFENYLLNVEAITKLFNETGLDHQISVSQEKVIEWLKKKGGEYPKGIAFEPLTTEWLQFTDAASILRDLFSELSDQKLRYQKTVHTPRLTELVHDIEPSATDELLAFVKEILLEVKT